MRKIGYLQVSPVFFQGLQVKAVIPCKRKADRLTACPTSLWLKQHFRSLLTRGVSMDLLLTEVL